jgi:WD40 repeat protein/serine/threonine protein kinase
MKERTQREQEILDVLRQIDSEAEREAYLKGACGDDADLMRSIRTLYEAYQDEANFLKKLTVQNGMERGILEAEIPEGPGAVIGYYKLLEKIGEGGMGVVYMAEQEKPLRRRVAFKIIKLGMDTKQVVARFEAERQALALMDHPNIAKVLDAGATKSGRPYFVMELVRGVPITEYCDKNRLSTGERLELFIPVCQAIQHAHQKGIIHRDIKPTNVLIALFDGNPVPMVIDFGVAKATHQRLTEKTLFTHFSQMVGTPAYMSPEQAEGSQLDIDTRSDVYSLGVLLYQLLTGTTPFSERRLREIGYVEMQRVIAEEEPPRPSTRLSTLTDQERTAVAKRHASDVGKLGVLLRHELDWIAMKALEKDRQRRYAAASDLVADIERHLKNEPVLATPPSQVYKLRKFVRRHRVGVAATVALAATLVLGGVVSTLQWIRADRERKRAEQAQAEEAGQRQVAQEAKGQAEAERKKAQRRLYASDINLAGRFVQADDIGSAANRLERHIPLPGQTDLRRWEWRYLKERVMSDELFNMGDQGKMVYSVVFSPDGRFLAAAIGSGEVALWNMANGQRTTVLQEDSLATALAFSPDGRLLAISMVGKTYLWNIPENKLAATLPGEEGDTFKGSLAFSQDGEKLALASDRRELLLWDTVKSEEISRIYVRWEPQALGFSKDGEHLVYSLWWRSGLQLWDIEARQHVDTPDPLKGVDFSVTLALSPDQETLAVGCWNGDIFLLDPTEWDQVGRLQGHTFWVASLKFSPDGSRLYSASADQRIMAWDVDTKQLLGTLKGHRHEIYDMDLSPDGSLLATGSKDHTVRLWRTNSFSSDVIRLKAVGWGYGPIASPDERFFLVQGLEDFEVWDAETMAVVGRYQVDLPGDRRRTALAPRGEFFASGQTSGDIRIFTAGGSAVRTLHSNSGEVLALRYSHDGSLLASFHASDGGEDLPDAVLIWHANSDVPTRPFHANLNREHPPVDFSHDGKLIAIGSETGNVHVWDVSAGKDLGLLEHGGTVYSVKFSSDNIWLAVVSDEGGICLWDVTTLQLARQYGKSSTDTFWSVDFAAEENRLFAGVNRRGKKFIAVYDFESEDRLVDIPVVTKGVRTLAWVNGDVLIWGAADGIVRVHRIPSFAALEAQARRQASREWIVQ